MMTYGSNKILRLLIYVLLCSAGMSACKQIDVYEKTTTIPQYKWDRSFPATGTFTISDTNTAYNIYIVMRHTDSYNYNNIWLNVGLQSPGDTMYFQKVEMQLADDQHGWEGTGMNDIWEVRKLVNGQAKRFIRNGEYHFSISQIMRDNPLPGIMNVGLRVEAAHTTNNFNSR
ncbi:MAG: gliding motility lipoprotein GldH [Bacteroidetes bacterium]|nr:gliding motility lipoprotein GldH [Bacteroidota bacterium]